MSIKDLTHFVFEGEPVKGAQACMSVTEKRSRGEVYIEQKLGMIEL